jgi:hypothetical protein
LTGKCALVLNLRNRAFKPIIITKIIANDIVFNQNKVILSGETAVFTLKKDYFCKFLNIDHSEMIFLEIYWKDTYGNTGVVKGAIYYPP